MKSINVIKYHVKNLFRFFTFLFEICLFKRVIVIVFGLNIDFFNAKIDSINSFYILSAP